MATVNLDLNSQAEFVIVTATLDSANVTSVIEVLNPVVDVAISASASEIQAGEVVTYSYQIGNPGEVPLVDIAVVDDQGMGNPITICDGISLDVGMTTTCPDVVVAPNLTTQRTVTATAMTNSGQPLADYEINAISSVTVTVLPPDSIGVNTIYLPVVLK